MKEGNRTLSRERSNKSPYAEAVRPQKASLSIDNTKGVIIFKTKKGDNEWASRGFVSVTRKVVPIGGRKVFIDSIKEEDLKGVLVEAKDIFFYFVLFVSVVEWTPLLTSWNRNAWLRISWIALHNWTIQFN